MSDTTDLTPEDFPADDTTGLTDAELRQLLTEARTTGNDALRRLLASYLTLRRLGAEVVQLIETREGAVTVVRTPLFTRLKHLTRRTRG